MSGYEKLGAEMTRKKYDHIILLAHGSTDSAWKEPFEALYQQLVARHGADGVSLAYMELTAPTLEQVVDNLSNNVQTIAVLPLFLAAGRHLRRDVPAQIEELQTPDRQIDLLAPIGDDDSLKQAMLSIISGHLGNNNECIF